LTAKFLSDIKNEIMKALSYGKPLSNSIGVTTVQKVGGRSCEARRAEARSPKSWERGCGSWGGAVNLLPTS